MPLLELRQLRQLVKLALARLPLPVVVGVMQRRLLLVRLPMLVGTLLLLLLRRRRRRRRVDIVVQREQGLLQLPRPLVGRWVTAALPPSLALLLLLLLALLVLVLPLLMVQALLGQRVPDLVVEGGERRQLLHLPWHHGAASGGPRRETPLRLLVPGTHATGGGSGGGSGAVTGAGVVAAGRGRGRGGHALLARRHKFLLLLLLLLALLQHSHVEEAVALVHAAGRCRFCRRRCAQPRRLVGLELLLCRLALGKKTQQDGGGGGVPKGFF